MGHFLQRRKKRQLSSLLARLGRRDGPRYLVSDFSQLERAAQRRQSRSLCQCRGRPPARARSSDDRAGRAKAYLWRNPASARRRFTLCAALVVEERDREETVDQKFHALSRRRFDLAQTYRRAVNHTVKRYILARLMLLLPTLFGVLTLVFFLIHMIP